MTRSPAGEGTDFDWRVSFAEIDAAGPFSAFPGVDRVLVVVDGPSLVLTVDGVDHPLRRHEPFAFAGESDTSAAISGPIVALNVMTRRGRCAARVDVVHLVEGAPLAVPYDDRSLVAVLDGVVRVTAADGAVRASRLDVVVASAPVTVEGTGTIAAIGLRVG